MRTALLFAALPLAIACGSEIDAGGDGVDAGTGDDPLVVDNPAEPGSLEELQRTVIQERCSGQPGLCHNGQFEPNLSTAANTYAYLVRRPAIEDRAVLRVNPGDPDSSFLIDKIRGRNGVSTQMPLGAEPLNDAEMQMFEDWISDGARRAPGEEMAPELNNPPNVPELGAFNGGTRIDGAGVYTVPSGVEITYRHSVDDFETADADITVAGIVFTTPMGNLENPASPGEDFFLTTFDSGSPPDGAADVLNFMVQHTIGATHNVITPTGVQSLSTAGLTITPLPIYADGALGGDSIITVRLNNSSFQVQ
jgi:hypothetical protein